MPESNETDRDLWNVCRGKSLNFGMAGATYYAVTESQGPKWDSSRPRRRQDKWDEHALFMDALVEDGFVVLGGPVGDGDEVLLIVRAESEAEIEARLAEDPWLPMEVLRIAKVDRWQIWLGSPART